MKIKVEKKMKLEELINWVSGHEFKKRQQIEAVAKNGKPNGSRILFFERDGKIEANFFTNTYNIDDLFSVWVEEKITEETVLEKIVAILHDNSSRVYDKIRIDSFFELPKYIYLQKEDGKIGDLIWTKEKGLL